jgi:hypothetical protein
LLLLCVLIIAIIGLIAAESNLALGLELFVVAAIVAVIVFCLPGIRAEDTGKEPTRWWLSRLGVRLMGTLPLVIGGLGVLLEAGGGLYWIAAGVILAIVGAVANAWVLLVEILR